MRRSTRRRRGFSLVELMVVIVIIGALVGLLLPVFGMAFREARKTQWRAIHRREPGPLWDANIMVLCGENGCVYEEYSAIGEALERADAIVTVVSTSDAAIPGTSGEGPGRGPDMLLAKAMDETYEWDGIIIVGGPGAGQYVNDANTHAFLHKRAEEGCAFAATSNAPLVLAQAGMLKRRRVTGDPGIAGFLVAAGADYTGGVYETDHVFATARGFEGVGKMMEYFVRRAER
ncbi:MAG: DJ-1/PfpI family protein [Planctomycetota bacterium]